jgi:activator of 2-hydroxyglutaryl-CoA dehydratase/predicted nucleotide-binding protein (sugar kinase/HSP70/actin superfamily)
VFSSSATISDKNQGIPLPVALATTLKSELLKTCSKLPAGFGRVVLCGRFFRWQFVRDCAEDYLKGIGVRRVEYDTENTLALDAMARLARDAGPDRLAQADPRLLAEPRLEPYPAFEWLHEQYLADHRYAREDEPRPDPSRLARLGRAPMHLALDVGSSMAKVAIADADGNPLYLEAYGNAGDTIETVKKIFRDLRAAGAGRLPVRSVGITGSARYQVREALGRIYPALSGRIHVLVENYAHARGSIHEARRHLARLKQLGVAGLNENFCVLVDVGGEDTKISTIALREGELFNNAMNIKCSAGTGSLLDTLAALFGLPGPAEASRLGYAAERAWAINATCAVFLMENAQKLQAQGVPRAEILASAAWAVVENMARTLWSQVELPGGCVILLHGQTMLSDPLPLAITHRMQSFLGRPVYCLVPAHPGHRACFGLVSTALQAAAAGAETIDLDDFLAADFAKRLIQCRGAACDDPRAVCNRTLLECRGADGRRFGFTLGGCSAINELFARSKDRPARTAERAARDPYKELWDFIDARQPRSDDPRRLVIPRSFAVSDWSYFFSQIFVELGLPVHVDSLRESDLRLGQPLFSIDTCAPHIGAAGQFRRLAGEPHGLILAPQIEYLCTDGKSVGRTCTTNQGGVAVAKSLAEIGHPEARFHLFSLSLKRLDAGFIADQLFEPLQAVFRHYGLAVERTALARAAERALERHRALRAEAADLAAELIEQALADDRQVALVVGREYVLNPGIYDSHVRRLLRDKRMAAIPSYVLDLELDEAYGDMYWRNPHFIVTLLGAVAGKSLHRRLRHPRLRELFRRLEARESLLPVVQVSTFSCGPDSVMAHLVAEIMKQRPFLLIQSDAIINELAHLENRVNTYVRQLETGLHAKLGLGGARAFEVRMLDGLEHRERVDRETDVIYCPTCSDNRPVTSVMRAAGFTCIDNYRDGDELRARVKLGRNFTGDAVCAPCAGVYADLHAAVEDFARRRATDPALRGKRRLLFFDNKGDGPCRQGQYVGVHKLLAYRNLEQAQRGDGFLRLLVGDEATGFDFGIEEWTLLRLYQATIVQGVLHELLFATAAECRDAAEYQRLLDDHRRLKREVHQALESYRGPGRLGRGLVAAAARVPGLGPLAKYFAYRLHGRDLQAPIRRFAARWRRRTRGESRLAIHVAGETYMRVALGESIFRVLLAQLGFRRFRMHLTPVWGYLEYLIEYEIGVSERNAHVAVARAAREGRSPAARASIRAERRRQRRLRTMRRILRSVLARPLYRAAGLSMPHPVAEAMDAARDIVPTLRPDGEFPSLVGEALCALRRHADVLLNVGPRGCLVSSMAAVMSPRLLTAVPDARGRIQHLFSADGEVDEEILAVALLKSLGPRDYFVRAPLNAG